jgi:membrane protease YdiL (CAAX protease family)
MSNRPGLLSGPPAYPQTAAARAPRGPLISLALSLAIFVAAILLGSLLQAVYVASSGAGRDSDGRLGLDAALVWLIGMQAAMIAFTLAIGAREGGAALRLHLVPPAQGPQVYGQALAFMLAGVGIYNAAAYAIGATDIVSDLKVYVEMAHSPAWLAALIVIGLGAPVSEELLFRGYLLPGLAASPIGYRGATVATTALWTVLHAGYSVSGLVEVALVGLYLSWVLWRTGSLWVTIFCHATYNTGLMLALMLWPKPV